MHAPLQGHPEASRTVAETYAAGMPAEVDAQLAECLSRLPPEQAAKLCPMWAQKWIYDTIGRMAASYVQYTGAQAGSSRQLLRAGQGQPVPAAEPRAPLAHRRMPTPAHLRCVGEESREQLRAVVRAFMNEDTKRDSSTPSAAR